MNEFAFVTFAYQHGLLPQPAYLAAERACGWADYLTDCGNETFYDNPSDACKAATTAALRYLPQNLDPYDVTAPTCQASARGAAHVRANAPFLERLQLDYGLDVSFDPCLSDYVETYLNRADVQAAIHAEPTAWRASGGVEYDNPGDVMVPYFETFINETDWRMLIWSGDADAAMRKFKELKAIEVPACVPAACMHVHLMRRACMSTCIGTGTSPPHLTPPPLHAFAASDKGAFIHRGLVYAVDCVD